MVDIPFQVLAHEQGTRIDLFLSRRIRRMSRSLAQKVIRGGSVRREPGGTVHKPSERLLSGDRVLLKRKRLVEAPDDHLDIPVIFQDDRLVAVAKPGDLVVHPTASAFQRTLVHIMRRRLGDPRLDLAHRIDKETSGLVLMVRDFEAAQDLNGQFARREVEKSYLAVVLGVPTEDEIEIDAPLRLVPNSLTRCLMEVGGAQAALTEVSVLARGHGAALVEARPKTGRQHQIRVHLAHLGFPIAGDDKYGDFELNKGLAQAGLKRMFLHAGSVGFEHPATGSMLTLEAPLPAELRAFLNTLN